MYEYTKITERIWQIAEDDGVCCTLVKGSKLAVLIDTGYGKRNLRKFVEDNISTPYIVCNSHGHPDHIGGNHWFDKVCALPKEWDVIRYFEEGKPQQYELEELHIGQQIALGDMHMEVVSLAGHTHGSVGFWMPEEKLLISGDALNKGLWLFNYGSLTMDDLYATIKRAVQMEFDTYLCGHSRAVRNKEKLHAHLRNIETLSLAACTRQVTIGFDTYCSRYADADGVSEIVFTGDKVSENQM